MLRTALAVLTCMAMVSVCWAQPGWSSQYADGGYVYYTSPTYNGVELNERSATILQWAAEVSASEGLEGSYAGFQDECVVSSQSPPCSTFQIYNTAGFNNGSWEVHDCTYAGWSWDNCYTRPIAIYFEETVPTESSSWGVIKALFR